MKTRVELDSQVADFVRSLAPEPRKAVRAALRMLQGERGDLKPLEGELHGFTRPRVRHYRVIVQFVSRAGRRIARCVYAERRSMVYELFSEILRGQ